jgi:hypothetical protein
MSELGLVSPEMQGIVNKPYGRQISYPVAASDIRKWAIAVYYPEAPPAEYLDAGAAEDGTLVAPLDFNPFAWGVAESIANGAEREPDPAFRMAGAMEHNLGIDPPALARALNGGVSATYTGVPIRPGDVITAESVIAGYTEREGRLGAMLLTETATTWTNQDGAEVKTNRMTLIRY